MATEKLPDLDALAVELEQLEHRTRELVRQLETLTARMTACPNDFGLAWGRSLAAEIEGSERRITELQTELFLHGR